VAGIFSPAGAQDVQLNGVAAVTANDVWAVGSYQVPLGNQYPLIEHWNGAQWTDKSSRLNLPGVSGLSAVSAVAYNDIWVVGGTRTAFWNGTKWTDESCHFSAGVLPPGWSDIVLTGVAAVPSSSDAWAVGGYTVSHHILVEHMDSTSSSCTIDSSSIVNSAGWDYAMLNGVAAVNASDVWAVGWYAPTHGSPSLPLLMWYRYDCPPVC
jgi:hypothetical protein